MMKIRIDPQKSPLFGSLKISSSKSQTLRAILFGSLAGGSSHVSEALSSPDARAMIRACQLFGAQINLMDNQLSIQGVDGKIKNFKETIDVGNSGIVLRFCSAIAALSEQKSHFIGDHSIQSQRPMDPLLNALKGLGVDACSLKKNGMAPLSIQGPLKGGTASLDGADSQPISALLIAGALSREGVELNVSNPGETPWVDITLDWLKRLGATIHHQEYKHYQVAGGCRFSAFNYRVPGDWSSAAFPIVAALITRSEVKLENLDPNDLQGDKKFLEIANEMGGEFVFEKDRTLRVSPGTGLKGIEVDINTCIDAIPALAVLACYAEGTTRIYNASVARTKECDRLACLAQELGRMGAKIEVDHDSLVIRGSALTGAQVSSHGDHRMAMALAIAALGAKGESLVEGCACIEKSYPSFYEDFRTIGARFRRNS